MTASIYDSQYVDFLSTAGLDNRELPVIPSSLYPKVSIQISAPIPSKANDSTQKENVQPKQTRHIPPEEYSIFHRKYAKAVYQFKIEVDLLSRMSDQEFVKTSQKVLERLENFKKGFSKRLDKCKKLSRRYKGIFEACEIAGESWQKHVEKIITYTNVKLSRIKIFSSLNKLVSFFDLEGPDLIFYISKHNENSYYSMMAALAKTQILFKTRIVNVSKENHRPMTLDTLTPSQIYKSAPPLEEEKPNGNTIETFTETLDFIAESYYSYMSYIERLRKESDKDLVSQTNEILKTLEYYQSVIKETLHQIYWFPESVTINLVKVIAELKTWDETITRVMRALEEKKDRAQNLKSAFDPVKQNIDHVLGYIEESHVLIGNLDRKVKDSLSGPKGLIPTGMILKTYPRTMEQLYTPQQNLLFSMIAHAPVGVQREIIARRFLILEEFYKKFENVLETLIRDQKEYHKAMVQSPQKEQEMRAEEIKKLEELKKDLMDSSRFDATAVAITTGMYPIWRNPSIEDVTLQAETTYNRLNSQLGFEDDPKKADEMAWAKDVMGMFFLNRWDYSNFCTSARIDMKQERLEDWMVKFIINLVADNANVKEELKAFFITKGFSEEVRAALSEKLDIIVDELITFLRRPMDAGLFKHNLQIQDEMAQGEKEGLEFRAFDQAAEDFSSFRQALITS